MTVNNLNNCFYYKVHTIPKIWHPLARRNRLSLSLDKKLKSLDLKKENTETCKINCFNLNRVLIVLMRISVVLKKISEVAWSLTMD